tara:strand:+ start:1986 stop:2834 length:849 start_codon:yes stop_codon:yes gene_type:complete
MSTSTFRIIPRLDIKGPNLVKGIKLEGLRALGDPKDYLIKYYEEDADELIIQDVVASLYNRNNLSKIIEYITSKVFIPITVGGGLRSIDDIENILRSGADKVSINSQGIKNPEIITNSVSQFGSSTIALSIEVIKYENRYLASYDNGRELTEINVFDWIKNAEELGIGEIILTNVDFDGTSKGIDKKLISKAREITNLPLLYHGGVSSFEDVYNIYDLGCNGAVIASCFHYHYLKKINGHIENKVEGNFDFIKNNITKNYNFNSFSIYDLKYFMKSKKVNIR